MMQDCYGFAILHHVIGLENSCHFLKKSVSKLKPIAVWSGAISITSDSLLVLILTSHWHFVIFSLPRLAVGGFFFFFFTTPS